jgi:GNAT superfamily N-acetyltransferase
MSAVVEVVGEEQLGELLPMLRMYCDFYRAQPSDADLLTLCRALLAAPKQEGVQLLARIDERPAGFATLFWGWSTRRSARIGTMNDLYVVPAARGTGTAEALVGACLEQCRRRGAVGMRWQTARDNHRAQVVYDRIGGQRERWVEYWLPVESARWAQVRQQHPECPLATAAPILPPGRPSPGNT